jgi:FkbM family methyltransferase
MASLASLGPFASGLLFLILLAASALAVYQRLVHNNFSAAQTTVVKISEKREPPFDRAIHFHTNIPTQDCSNYPKRSNLRFETVFFNTSRWGTNRHFVLGLPEYYARVNSTSHKPYDLMSMLEETYEDLFVDVGANIGKYVLTGLIFGIQTLAVEPITDNIDAICGGWQETTKRLEIGVNGSRHVTLLQAAASKKSSDAVNISRPLGRGAKLDQSSLFGNTIGVVRRPKLSYDVVPMIRLDEVIPVDIPVGLVKIDVQGAEKWVS